MRNQAHNSSLLVRLATAGFAFPTVSSKDFPPGGLSLFHRQNRSPLHSLRNSSTHPTSLSNTDHPAVDRSHLSLPTPKSQSPTTPSSLCARHSAHSDSSPSWTRDSATTPLVVWTLHPGQLQCSTTLQSVSETSHDVHSDAVILFT